jgi:hypothetical protein
MDKSFASLLNRFDEMHAAFMGGRDMKGKHTDDKKEERKDNKKDESYDDNWDAYTGDTEHEDRDQRRHRRSTSGFRRGREVHSNNDAFTKIKFKIPPFDGKYDPDAYITWEIAVDQKFTCHDFPEATRVRAATSEFTDFASVWWIEYAKKNPNKIPQTWNALKR